MNIKFSGVNSPKANKHMTRSLTSLAVKKIQIKTNIYYFVKSIRYAKIKRAIISRAIKMQR